MRVLVITPWWPTCDQPRSAPFMVHDVGLLSDEGDVVVLHLDARATKIERSNYPQEFRVVRVPFDQSKPWTWPRAAMEVRKLSKAAGAVHTMAMAALLPTFLAKTGKPWVHTEHYSLLVAENATQRQRRALRFLSALLRFPDHIVTVGKALADAVGPHTECPVSTVPNYVMTNRVAAQRELRVLTAGDPIRMIGVGGLIDRKGPIEAVDALADLRRRGYDATLTWAGEGPLREKVEEHAEALGVADELDLVGSVPSDTLSRALATSDVFVLPTENETFGVALAEALGHGLPVVTSGVGGHLEFLPERGSRVVSARNGATLADAVEELLSDPNRLSPMETFDLAESLFSPPARREGYRQAYRSALASGGKSDRCAGSLGRMEAIDE